MVTKPIPVEAARFIAQVYGYDQVVVIGRKTGMEEMEHVTTYGVNRAHCAIAARMGEFFKYKLMHWPNVN